MADKIASGAWHESPPSRSGPGKALGDAGSDAAGADTVELERLRSRRDSARWSAVVGFALMFGASFHSSFLFGGVAMVLYGASASVYWSWRLRRLTGDPWAYDPELDGPQAPGWSREGRPPNRADAERDDPET